MFLLPVQASQKDEVVARVHLRFGATVPPSDLASVGANTGRGHVVHQVSFTRDTRSRGSLERIADAPCI